MSYPTTKVGDQEFVFALHPRDFDKHPVGSPLCCSGVYGVATPPLIPRKDWPTEAAVCPEFSGHDYLNQKTLSLCHSFSATKAHERARWVAGAKLELLSPAYLAGMVTGHRDRGASIQDVAEQLLNRGQVPRSLVATYDYQGRDWPNTCESEAVKFTPVGYDTEAENAIDAIVTGLLRDCPAVIGTNAFGGGHAVEVHRYRIDSKGRLILGGDNSWGEDWSNCGRPGEWEYPESALGDIPGFGAIILQCVKINPDDAPGDRMA